MAAAFRLSFQSDGVLVELVRKTLVARKVVDISKWQNEKGLVAAPVRSLLRMQHDGSAEIRGAGLFLPSQIVGALSASVADAIGLPAPANLSATISFEGILNQPEARLRVRWYDANFSIRTVRREGAFLIVGSDRARLLAPVYHLMEAIDGYNATEGESPKARISAWGPVQDGLRRTTGLNVDAEGEYLQSLSIYQAGSFALDIRETANGPDFFPVPMAKSKIELSDDSPPAPEDGEDAAPGDRDQFDDALLPPELQEKFLSERFIRDHYVHDAYVIGRNTFLVLDEPVKRALEIVRRTRFAPEAERREFVRNPRAAIAQELGDDLAALFIETSQYSERVLGLGVWQKPQLPWIKTKAGQWLPESFTIRIGEREIVGNRDNIVTIARELEQAKAAGATEMQVDGVSTPINEVERALAPLDLESLGLDVPIDPLPEPPNTEPLPAEIDSDRDILLIKQNFEGLEYEVGWPKRKSNLDGLSIEDLARTPPKEHQIRGIEWLKTAWGAGWPGVLLADDMGVGKTYQALVFLAWLRRSLLARGEFRGAAKQPILIVAPTALLRNWASEAKRHLCQDALGDCVEVFGAGLRRLKTEKSAEWSPETALDIERLRDADWILTTYETLANYHRAFARIGYSAVVFDEAQKIKSPGSVNTQTAKSLNADFVLAMTGTPIENRLADLWCIMDRVVPGYLGELRSFVKKYEEGTADDLKDLKGRLDQPFKSAPPVLLRRMKEEILDGLPEKAIETISAEMPPAQQETYDAALAKARLGERNQAAMLKAIHSFRGISLHPYGATGVDTADPTSVKNWIVQSARMMKTVELLDTIRQKGEKALVFIEDREVQAAFADAMETHFDLQRPPMIINGATAGEKRLDIVDAFQAGQLGFDLLVLSPKAAGVGLTITAANHVIHLSRWWNPAVEDQCNDRVYRIGQTLPVTIYVPMARHPGHGDASFDLSLNALLERKRSLSRTMLLPPVSDSDASELFGATLGE